MSRVTPGHIFTMAIGTMIYNPDRLKKKCSVPRVTDIETELTLVSVRLAVHVHLLSACITSYIYPLSIRKCSINYNIVRQPSAACSLLCREECISLRQFAKQIKLILRSRRLCGWNLGVLGLLHAACCVCVHPGFWHCPSTLTSLTHENNITASVHKIRGN